MSRRDGELRAARYRPVPVTLPGGGEAHYDAGAPALPCRVLYAEADDEGALERVYEILARLLDDPVTR